MASRILIALLACSLSASAFAQEVYTWKDSNGRTHFADKAPLGVDAKPLRGNMVPESSGNTEDVPADASKPAASKKSGPKSWEEQDRDFKQRQAEKSEAEAKAKKEKAEKAEKERYCSDLRRNLAMLERGGRISRANDKGESIPLSDSQLQAEIERNRSQLAKDCK